MGGGSVARPFSETAFLTATSTLLGAWEPQHPPSNLNRGPEQWGVAPSFLHETTNPGEPCGIGKANSQAFAGIHLGDVVRRSGCALSLERQRKESDYNPHSASRDGERLKWARWLPGAVVTRQLQLN